MLSPGRINRRRSADQSSPMQASCKSLKCSWRVGFYCFQLNHELKKIVCNDFNWLYLWMVPVDWCLCSWRHRPMSWQRPRGWLKLRARWLAICVGICLSGHLKKNILSRLASNTSKLGLWLEGDLGWPPPEKKGIHISWCLLLLAVHVTAPINLKLTPVMPARLKVFEVFKVPTAF